MATNPKANRSHLSVVPPIPAFVPYLAEAETTWWTCPRWCPGDCIGGGLWHAEPQGHAYEMAREHERTVYQADTVDKVDGGEARISVTLERSDWNEDGWTPQTDVVLTLTGSDYSTAFSVTLTRAQRRELAAALLNADDLDGTTDAAPVTVAA
ncbi:hypothetical protein ACQEVZ_24675 [Dactylosporangium sp. CA-152071]|uniref:hypothetical protein n=1 Tax=Dactylosporangium sp. CA-152071 TaxID=3239933 RepID=UPI003D9246BF